MFIRKEDLPEARRRIRCHQQFKTLNTKLVRAHVALARKAGLNGGQS